MRIAISAVAAGSGLVLLGLAFFGQPATYLRQAREEWDALIDVGPPDTTVPDTTMPDTTMPRTTMPDTTTPDTTVDATPAEPPPDRQAPRANRLADAQPAPTTPPQSSGDTTPREPQARPATPSTPEMTVLGQRDAIPPSPEPSRAETPEPPRAAALAPTAQNAAPVQPVPAAPAETSRQASSEPPVTDGSNENTGKPAPLAMASPKATPEPPPPAPQPSAAEPPAPPKTAAPQPSVGSLASKTPERGESLLELMPRVAEQRKPEPAKAAPQKLAAIPRIAPAPPPLPQPPPRQDPEDAQSVLARLRQLAPSNPPIQQSEEAPASAPAPRLRANAPSLPRLAAARAALLNGRIEDARRLLQEVQLQLVFRPTDAAGDDPPSAGKGSADVAHALDALSANEISLSRRYIEAAADDLSGGGTNAPIQQSDRRPSGYAPAYPPR